MPQLVSIAIRIGEWTAVHHKLHACIHRCNVRPVCITRRGVRVVCQAATATKTVKIGTRGSPLALAQAYMTRDLLKVLGAIEQQLQVHG